MFDATFFQTALPAQIAALGDGPTVELFLIGGQAHRVRGIEQIGEGYVVLDVYQRRSDGMGSAMPWVGSTASPPASSDDTHRAIVSYDAISQVIITRTAKTNVPRIGF